MNTSINDQRSHRISEGLGASRAAVHTRSPMNWEVQPDAFDRAVDVHGTEDWVLLEAPVDASACAVAGNGVFLPEQLLLWNTTLPGGAKFGVNGRFQVSVRAEVSLFDEHDPAPRVTAALAGVVAGLARFHGLTQSARPSVAASPDLKTLATESGWAFNERDDGRVLFDLPSPQGPVTALLESHEEIGTRILLTLAELDGLGPASRRALAVLLLRAGNVLRLARPAFVIGDAGTSACLEAVFNPAPSAAELTQALESLAVGVALMAAEATLLCNEQTAGEYLTAGEWLPREETTTTTNNQRTT